MRLVAYFECLGEARVGDEVVGDALYYRRFVQARPVLLQRGQQHRRGSRQCEMPTRPTNGTIPARRNCFLARSLPVFCHSS